MEKKKLITRLVVFLVVLVLLIVAAVLPGGDVMAGAGNGTDARIESLEGLSALLRGMKTDFSAPTEEMLSGSVRLGEGGDGNSYESVTLSERTKLDIEYSYSISDTYTSHITRMNRDLTVYMTKEAAYYVSDLKIATSSLSRKSGEETLHTVNLSTLMRIYVGKDAALIRMDRYSATIDGEAMGDTDQFIGRWIDLTSQDEMSVEEVIDELTGVNNENYDTLALMGEFIDDRMEGFIADDGGNIFTMKADTFRSFLQQVLALQGEPTDLDPDVSGEFVADLFDSTQPKIYFDLKNHFSEDVRGQSVTGPFGTVYSTPSYSIRAFVSETDDFTFRNINNTEVGEPDRDGAMTLDEMIEILKGASDE